MGYYGGDILIDKYTTYMFLIPTTMTGSRVQCMLLASQGETFIHISRAPNIANTFLQIRPGSIPCGHASCVCSFNPTYLSLRFRNSVLTPPQALISNSLEYMYTLVAYFLRVRPQRQYFNETAYLRIDSILFCIPHIIHTPANLFISSSKSASGRVSEHIST